VVYAHDNIDIQESTFGSTGIYNRARQTHHGVIGARFEFANIIPSPINLIKHTSEYIDSLLTRMSSPPAGPQSRAEVARNAIAAARADIRRDVPAVTVNILPSGPGTATDNIGIVTSMNMTLKDARAMPTEATSGIPLAGDHPIFMKQLKLTKANPSFRSIISLPGTWHTSNAVNRAVFHLWSGFGLYSLAQLLGVVHLEQMHTGVNAAATTRTMTLLVQVTGSALVRLHPNAKTFSELIDATKEHKVQAAIAVLFFYAAAAVSLHHGIRENRPDLQMAAIRDLAPLMAGLGRHQYALLMAHVLHDEQRILDTLMKVGAVGHRAGHAMAVDEALENHGVRLSKQNLPSTRTDADGLRTHITTINLLTERAKRLKDMCLHNVTSTPPDKESTRYDEAVTYAADTLEAALRLPVEEALQTPLFRAATCFHDSKSVTALLTLKEEGQRRLDTSFFPEVRGESFSRKGRGARALPNVVYEVKARKTTKKTKPVEELAQASLKGAKEAAENGDLEAVKQRLAEAEDVLLSYPPPFANVSGKPIRAEKSKALDVYRRMGLRPDLPALPDVPASGYIHAIDLTQLVMRVASSMGASATVAELAKEVWGRATTLRSVKTLVLVADRPDYVPAAKIFEQLAREGSELHKSSGKFQEIASLIGKIESKRDGEADVRKNVILGHREVRNAVTAKILSIWCNNPSLFSAGSRLSKVVLDGPGMAAPVQVTKVDTGVKVDVLERKFHFGEADVALFAHVMGILESTEEEEVCVFEINDTDALDIGLAASVSRMISPVKADLKHTWVVRKLTPYEVFDLNAIFAHVVKESPSAWVAATSVVSFVCARVVSGNDYKERTASDAKSVLEAYLQQVHDAAAHAAAAPAPAYDAAAFAAAHAAAAPAPAHDAAAFAAAHAAAAPAPAHDAAAPAPAYAAAALASASWHQESRTATVIFEEEAIKAFISRMVELSSSRASPTACAFAAKRAIAAADYATCLARGATVFPDERWVDHGGFQKLDEGKCVSASNIAIAWDATPRRTLLWPSLPSAAATKPAAATKKRNGSVKSTQDASKKRKTQDERGSTRNTKRQKKGK